MEAGPGVVQTPFTLASAGIQDVVEGKPRPVEGKQEQQDVLDQLNTEAPKGEYKVNGGAVTRKALMELITDVTDEEAYKQMKGSYTRQGGQVCSFLVCICIAQRMLSDHERKPLIV